MLIELAELQARPGRPPLARVRTPLGPAVAVWHGAPDARLGPHHVEWTLDEELELGRNAVPAGEALPGVRVAGERLLLRGQLLAPWEGTAVLDLGGEPVLVDLAGAASSADPALAEGSWVELTVEVERVWLYPFTL
ncbi:hypothetical protein ACFYNO_28335 [Kitasatospora sp. NPDC006697]|uniref:hypothetical protein n=1 Tax=Kitasatospora sp. NPDC006697 TaxID=3364020 RepID=UPI0036C53067